MRGILGVVQIFFEFLHVADEKGREIFLFIPVEVPLETKTPVVRPQGLPTF